MKIRTDDIYRVEKTKYHFANSIISGKVLDITYGKYLDFTKSKLLLDHNVDEVWSLDLLDEKQHVILRKLNEGKITFEKHPKSKLDTISFDAILSFNIFSIVNNVQDNLEFISNHLTNSGISIISIVNDDGISDAPHDLLTKDLFLFSKSEFEKNLKNYFHNVELFSQGIVTPKNHHESKIKNMFKIKLRNFFLGSTKHLNFYLKYIRPIQNHFVTTKQNLEIKKIQKYEITPFDEKKKPLFTIAVCKNIHQ